MNALFMGATQMISALIGGGGSAQQKDCKSTEKSVQ